MRYSDKQVIKIALPFNRKMIYQGIIWSNLWSQKTKHLKDVHETANPTVNN